MEKMDSHDLCRLRDDIATILMAVTSMKHEVEKSDITEYAKKNLLQHYQRVIEDLNFIIVIMLGLAHEMEAKEKP
jgi:hypothetical protein